MAIVQDTKKSEQLPVDEYTPLMTPAAVPAALSSSSLSSSSLCVADNNTSATAVSASTSSTRRKLWFAVCIAILFFITELVAGFFANSLALMSDAFHLLADVASFIVALVAIYLAELPPTSKHTFGFHRAEVIAAMVSVLTIWILTAFLVNEAIQRLQHPQDIDARLMCITASIGVAVNLVLAYVLGGHHHHHHHHNHDDHHCHDDVEHQEQQQHGNHKMEVNMNLRAATLHVLGDLLASVGVLLSSIILLFNPKLTMVDPICTFIFAVIVLYTTIQLIMDSLDVLMECAPSHIQLETISKTLITIPGVVAIHDLHVWSLAPGKTFLTAHIVAEAPSSPGNGGCYDGQQQQHPHHVDHSDILAKSQHILTEQLGISHLTLQIESEDAQFKQHCRPDLCCTNYPDDT